MRQSAIQEAIARELDLIARLSEERQLAYDRLADLQAQLKALSSGGTSAPYDDMGPREKIALFKSLFRGRDDVYPKLWHNPKSGKKGYSPACSNEWARPLCEKPRVKCSECPNQAFISVTDRVIQEHLQGRHVMGVYALLRDETCWFLAVDFDKGEWREDVAAFREVSASFGLHATVERSRSGNGAHAWFFFAAPVPAVVARKMGCYLLTETMARRHQVGLDSYDRLFPNQDTMPQGGFGNLIALPLQREARGLGNTLFLDEQMEPYVDQWAYLAGVQRISLDRIEAIVREGERQGRIVGVRIAPTEDEDDATPWARQPKPKRHKLQGPMPAALEVVVANRLFVTKEGVPSALADQIKRLAAFQNPEFYKKQSMRLSTAQTPRVIHCAEELSHHIALPRGCLPELEELCVENGIGLHLDDKREEGQQLGFTFEGELTPLQQQAARAMLASELGVFVAPPGAGKTVVGTHLIAERGLSTLVLVHRKPLLEQWVARLSQFLEIDPKEIGRIGGGKGRPNGRLDVAMLQSLARRGDNGPPLSGYGHVVVDECHHLPAFSFERALNDLAPRYVTGLTATPFRRDGHQPIIHMQCGPTRFAVNAKSQKAQRPFEHRLIVRETSFRPNGKSTDVKIQTLYAELVRDEERNALILADVRQALRDGRSPILLTERKEHLEFFAARLRNEVRHLVILKGGTSTKAQREVEQQLATIPDDEERLLIATGRYIGEGFDDARLDTLFLTLPVSWKGTLVQYAGRLHRLHAAKEEVRIYDYVDLSVPMLARMFEKRLRGYRTLGYVQEQPKH